MPEYLRYAPALEKPAPDEHVTFDEISRTMQHITRSMAAHYRHAYRPVHAKSHGVLVGKLEVLHGLPSELAQGLFATPGEYDVILRFSTNPGDLLADNVSSPRGLAIKILNVEGDKLPPHTGATQDLVCVNANAFSAPDPAGFLKTLKLLDKTLELPEGVKHAVSVAAQSANAVLKLAHIPSAALESLGAPATHILGESFSTVAPLRFGDFVAKLGIAPVSPNLTELTGKHVNLGADYNALEDLIKHFFRHDTAVWELKAQLALAEEPALEDKDKDFPIEKADTVWPEEKSSWQVVARIVCAPQDSYSDARQLFVDERLSFNPFHALAAHQPLGGIMRARCKAYEEAAKYRAVRNDRVMAEPTSIAEVPA